jgi:hypothetical protein
VTDAPTIEKPSAIGALFAQRLSRIASRAEKVAWTAMKEGAMPIFERRRPRRWRGRVAALVATALAGGALAAPSPASAAEEWFCGGYWLESTQQCRGYSPAWLWSVAGFVGHNQYHRICAASASSTYGYVNSEWRCDYGTVGRVLAGSVYGVGAVRNGAPFGYYVGVGIQSW